MTSFPEDMLPTKLFNSQSPPLLWIGAGMSKRYLSSKDWNGLLEEIAYKLGFNKESYTAKKNLIKKELGPEAQYDEIMAAIASYLSDTINEKVSEGKIKTSDIFDDEFIDNFYAGVDPLKLAICSLNRDIEFNKEYESELDLFKNLLPYTPVVITTNYDCMLEELCDDKYTIYTGVDDYYRNESIGIGELYKIHGSVNDPESLIISTEDYQKFNKQSSVVVSKLTSLICENPVVIMGYSLNDRFIRDLLGNMFQTFSKDVCNKLADNILYLDYVKNSKPELGKMRIESSSGIFYIRTLSLDDFSPIYENLMTCTHSYPVSQIRKIKNLLLDIVKSSDPSKIKRIMYIGFDNLDDLNLDAAVVGLANPATAQAIKSFASYTVDDLLNDIFDNDLALSPESVIRIWFENSKLSIDQYLPIFPYLSKLNLKREDYSTRMIKYIDKKREQYKGFANKKRTPLFRNIHSELDLIDAMNSEYKCSRADLILYSFINGIINESKAMNLLKAYHKKIGNDTAIKRAVTMIFFKKYL